MTLRNISIWSKVWAQHYICLFIGYTNNHSCYIWHLEEHTFAGKLCSMMQSITDLHNFVYFQPFPTDASKTITSHLAKPLFLIVLEQRLFYSLLKEMKSQLQIILINELWISFNLFSRFDWTLSFFSVLPDTCKEKSRSPSGILILPLQRKSSFFCLKWLEVHVIIFS